MSEVGEVEVRDVCERCRLPLERLAGIGWVHVHPLEGGCRSPRPRFTLVVPWDFRLDL